jgi:hypothetical protein
VVDHLHRGRDRLSSYYRRHPDVEDPSSADPDLLLVVRDYCKHLAVDHPFDLVVVPPYHFDDLRLVVMLMVVALSHPDDYQMVSDDDQNRLDPLLRPESSMPGRCLSLFLDCSFLVNCM